MADKEKKEVSGATIGLVLLGLAWVFGKKPPSGEGEAVGAGISIQIFDAATGQPVPQNSPAAVEEGKRIYARVTVTNLSKKSGIAVAVDLQIKIDAYVGGTTLPFTDEAGYSHAKNWVANFLANQAIPWAPYFTIPPGTAGESAAFTAAIWTPPLGAGALIPGAATLEPLVISPSLIYGASVTIQVP